jgi:tetratricopeptide (TPR) repeat protein
MKTLLAIASIAGPIFAAGCASRSGSSGPPKAYLDLCERGQAQVRNEDYAGARTTFRETLSRHPDQIFNANVELLLSDCERQLGNEAEARRLREKVARSAGSPDLKMRANFGLGKMALAGERFDEAASRFRAALAASGEATAQEKASIRLQTGIALQSGGQFAEARQEFGRAIEEAPESPSAKQARTQLLYPDHFAVQTGAFKDPKNAEDERTRLKEKGFPAEVVTMDLPQGKFHCVRVGKFADRRQAVEFLERIRTAKALRPKAKPTVKP